MDQGGNKPCALNAANEVVVKAFLEDRIGFLEMADIIETSIDKIPLIEKPSYEEYVETDKETRIKTLE
jgi:1-deoxy-D-xylulose-5-phosphate reductoisomerase